MNVDEIVYLYVEAYKEGFALSTKSSYGRRKGDARRHAAAVCPEGGAALVERAKHTKEGNGKGKEFEIGQKILSSLSAMRLGGKKTISPPQQMVLKSDEKKTEQTILAKIEAVCKLGFVPTDKTCAILLDCHCSTPRAMRYHLRSRGYEFEQVENGWVVKEAKTKEQIEIDEIKTQMEKLSQRLSQLSSNGRG